MAIFCWVLLSVIVYSVVSFGVFISILSYLTKEPTKSGVRKKRPRPPA